MEVDIRTKCEIERDQKHAQIITDYLALMQQVPEASPNRLMTKVAEKYGMTTMGVRGILLRNNIILTQNS